MKDNFSKQAGSYARYRPHYPQPLFDFIFDQTPQKQNAWDCGTGNGQSAKVLATRFEKVFATDISQKQIDKAEAAANIFYSVQPAEHTNFDDDTFDLIVISQALHWFAKEEFYREAVRVSKPRAFMAAWSYSLLNISPEIDPLIGSFYTGVVGPYWDPERRYVDEEYKTILFPLKDIVAPRFVMEYYWAIDELEGYINTWSALQKFIATNEYNPVPALMEQIRRQWPVEKMKVTFPLHMRIGQIEK